VNKVSIFSTTSAHFGDYHLKQHGRGFFHALNLYKKFFKQGLWDAEDPMFKNAMQLFQEITNTTDRTSLRLVERHQNEEADKVLLSTTDGYAIEAVVLHMQHGKTLCVSSQVGCKMGCTFCETGRMGLLRSLRREEIVQQLYLAKFTLGYAVDNVVFMGMGEPFDNYDEVLGAVEIMTDQNGFALGMNAITVSTSGKIEGIARLAKEKSIRPNLAVSITAALDDLRSKLMPHNRRENLLQLHQAIKGYNMSTGKSVLLACAMMQGINDTQECAEALVQFSQGLDVKINLIPYNSQRQSRFVPSSDEQIQAFSAILQASGLQVLYRKTKGRSLMAACGQLGQKQIKKVSA
jgi:23S rRNA (adenine2503-C2)-methyltransferase